MSTSSRNDAVETALTRRGVGATLIVPMDSDDKIRVGAFEVLEPIGEGGMGAVYRGRHVRDGTETALKLMLTEQAREPKYRREFQREVQALARLNHPGIATVYDYGTLGEEAAEAGPEAFVAGTPWMAMELVDGRTFEEVAGRWGWEETVSGLLQLLDALAHAHARDVLHRDLKPSNILIPTDGSSLTVVDFGIAAVFEDPNRDGVPDSPDRIKGTPKYMAPEQILGEWRDQGPWTDLYAVGCMVWWFLCGEPRFDGGSTTEVLQAHLDRWPAEFRPRFPVPDEIEAWLERLLVRDPHRRFRRAADAAWMLVELTSRPAPVPERPEGDGTLPEEAHTLRARPTLGTLSETDLDLGATIPDVPEASQEISREIAAPEVAELPTRPPPIPPNWQRTRVPVAEPLSNAGLELFGLRRLSVVDREGERDLLWAQLRETANSEDPAAVLLHGEAGSGKSKLADWLTRRADELGVARGIRADHSRSGGPSEGLEAMLVRHFRLEGLSESEAVVRFTDRLEALGMERQTALYDAHGILAETELSGAGSSASGFQGPHEHHVAIRRILRAMASERPLILWLDDIPWGRRTARFVEFLFDEPTDDPLPILVVMTGRQMVFDQHPEVAERVETAVDGPRGQRLEIERLDREDHREMVRRLLGFSETLVDEIVDRTEGHPLFAIQLVTDWLERGALEEGEEGFELADDAEAAMPDNLRQLWERRVDWTLARLPETRADALRRMLELGAALGRRIDLREWRIAGRKCGVDVPVAFIEETLVRDGLVEPDPDGGRFVHRLLVDSLRHRARREDRWARYNRICAQTIDELSSDDNADANVRIARFWVEAGDRERALGPLLRAARRQAEFGDYEREAELIERRREILDTLELTAEDRRRIENRVRRAWSLMHRGNHEEAAGVAAGVVQVARQAGWPRLEAEARLVTAGVLHFRGDIDQSIAHLDRAQHLFREQGERDKFAECLRMRGMNAQHAQRLDRASTAFERARRQFEELGDQLGVLKCDERLLWLHIRQDDLATADDFGRDLLQRAERHNLLSVQLGTSTALGEAAKYRERWEEAVEHFRRAEHLAETTGHRRNGTLMAINRAMVEAADGNFERSARQLVDLEERVVDLGMERYRSVLHIVSMVCAAGRGRWEEWEANRARVERDLEAHEMRFRDQPWLLGVAARTAAEQGAADRARAAYRLAARLWEELDEPEEARRARSRA